jgi:hypothetical protein
MTADVIQAMAETLREGGIRDAFGRAAVLCLGEEVVRIRARVAELEAGIRAHRDARGHDRCWIDDLALYALLPGEPLADLRLPPRCEFMAECERYWEHRQPGRVESVTRGPSS